MSYHSIFQQLIQALLFVGVMLASTVLLVSVYMRVKKRTFLWKLFIRTYWLGLALLVYYMLVLRITCFSRSEFQGISLRLFSSYENAWFGGSSNNWQQLILNILMFVPIGVMLVVVHPRMKRWYINGLICLFASMCIEMIQYVFHLGVFEVDDLLNNTLGGLLGYSMIMFALKLKHKQFSQVWRYGILPFLVLAIGLAAWIRYDTQPYGNLYTDSFFQYNWGDTKVTYKGTLSSKQASVGIYQMKHFSEESIDDLMQDLSNKLHIKDKLVQTDHDTSRVYSYDDGQITINKETGTWDFYRYTGQDSEMEEGVSKKHEAALMYGQELGLIDHFAKDVSEDDASGAIWQWELDGKQDGLYGYVMIDCNEAGELLSIRYDLVPYRFVKQEKIISQQDAFQRVKDGSFRPWRTMTHDLLTFKEGKLDYDLDTKNYLQPVYRFYGESETGGQEIVISALAN